MTIWYSFQDFFEAQLPSKDESGQVADVILKAKAQLLDYKLRQAELGDKETEALAFNNRLDERLIWVTLIEVLVILVVFMAELAILSRYLKYKEIV